METKLFGVTCRYNTNAKQRILIHIDHAIYSTTGNTTITLKISAPKINEFQYNGLSMSKGKVKTVQYQ